MLKLWPHPKSDTLTGFPLTADGKWLEHAGKFEPVESVAEAVLLSL